MLGYHHHYSLHTAHSNSHPFGKNETLGSPCFLKYLMHFLQHFEYNFLMINDVIPRSAFQNIKITHFITIMAHILSTLKVFHSLGINKTLKSPQSFTHLLHHFKYNFPMIKDIVLNLLFQTYLFHNT